jgi:AcrR family transcriptional regulator
MVVTPWGEAGSLRERRLHPGPGSSAEDVAKNQRERLFGAMVAAVAAEGYAATRVADLVKLSGVSSRSFYDLYPNKEACFVAMLEELLSTTLAALERAEDPAADWNERLRQTYGAFAQMLAAQPASATIGLSEAYAAGPAARPALEKAAAGIERLTRRRLAESPERAGMPEEMVVAHVGALQEIARARLRDGEPGEVAALVPELVDLMLSYRPPPEPLRLAGRAPSFGPESVAAHDDAERALRAFAVAVAEHGYAAVTVHEIARIGGMSPTTFYANFRDKQDAMLAAIDSAMAQLTTAALTAFQRSPGWAAGVRAAIGSALNFLASRPAMAYLLAVEVHGGGPEALRRRAQGARPLTTILAQGYAQNPDVPPITPEAIAGGLARLVRRRLLETGPEALPALAPIATYIVLSPFVGPEQAAKAANGDGRSRLLGESGPTPRAAVPEPSKWSVIMVLATRSATAEELADLLEVPAATATDFLEQLEAEEWIERIRPRGPDGPLEWAARKRARQLESEDLEVMTTEERRDFTGSLLASVRGDLELVEASEVLLRRVDQHITRLQVSVDQQGFEDLAALHRSAFEATRAIQEESRRRVRDSGEPTFEARSTQVLFTPPEPEADPGTDPGV